MELWRITGFDRAQGYPPTELLFSRIHPDDLQRMVEANRQVSEAGRPLNIQYRFFRPDGELRVLHSVGTVVHDDGEAAQFVGATQDVTEQEERTEDLKRSEAYLAEGQRLSHTGSFGWNIATGEIFWSEEMFRIFEYDRANKPTLDLSINSYIFVSGSLMVLAQKRSQFSFQRDGTYRLADFEFFACSQHFSLAIDLETCERLPGNKGTHVVQESSRDCENNAL